jgi:hypothetical protein
LKALLIVNDTECKRVDTVHGKVEFMQLVGITERELEVIKEDTNQKAVLVENMRSDNPYLITDIKRIKSYI